VTDANSDGYAGQRSPTDTGSEFNKIHFLVESVLSRIHTMKLVKVVSVTNAGELKAVGSVDVVPLVNQIDGDGNAMAHETIYGVPYTRIQGGKNAFIMDPVKGDIGWMAVSDRDISGVKSKKDATTPGSFRKYDIADGVYLGGILNGVPEQYITFTSTGIKVADKNSNVIETTSSGVKVTDKNSNILEMKSDGISVNGLLVNREGQVAGNLPVTGALRLSGSIVNLTGARYTGNIDTAGNITSDTVVLKTHTHSGVSTGGGTSGPPTP
jgi:hypothetical protein